MDGTAGSAPETSGTNRERVPDGGWLDRGQQADWRAFITGATYLLAALERDLEEAGGLSLAEYEVLVRLSEQPGRRMRMAGLADGLVHSRSRTTHTVARMERAGLVRRVRACGDGRGREAEMTEQGWDLLQAAAPRHVDSVRERLVTPLSREQLAALGEAMRAVATGAGLTVPGAAPAQGTPERLRD